jgi:hypothetical protein
MQTRDKGKQSEEEGDKARDLELENTVGNLLIAEYQVEKLRTRLADLIEGFRPEMRYNRASTHVFKHNSKWYKISLRIDEMDTNSTKEAGQDQFTGYSAKK